MDRHDKRYIKAWKRCSKFYQKLLDEGITISICQNGNEYFSTSLDGDLKISSVVDFKMGTFAMEDGYSKETKLLLKFFDSLVQLKKVEDKD